MFCEKCGNALPGQARFCNRCGAPTSAPVTPALSCIPATPASEVPSAETDEALFASTPLAFTYENGYHPQDGTSEPQPLPVQELPDVQPVAPKKPRKRVWLIVLAAVLALLLSGAATFGLLRLIENPMLSGTEQMKQRLETTWYLNGSPEVELVFNDGAATVTQSTGIPMFDIPIASFRYTILDANTLRITTQSGVSVFTLQFSDDGTQLSVTPSLSGSAGESWTTDYNAAERFGYGGYYDG